MSLNGRFCYEWFLPWAMALSVVVVVSYNSRACCACGLGEEMPETQDPSKADNHRMSGIELHCIIADNQLTIRLVNRSTTPIVVDRDLVFLVQITAKDRFGKDIATEEVKSVRKGLQRISPKDRLVRVAPGNEIKRTIDLKRPFRVFVTAKSFPGHKTSAYEEMRQIAKPKKIRSICVRYGPHFGFQDGFQHYTGQTPKDVHLFLGPCECDAATDGSKKDQGVR